MLGLVILLGLFIWLLLTKIAIVIGAKWGKRLPIKRGRLLGGFLGFMLLMGGFIVYWIGEYIYIQAKVIQLCKSEGEIKVYVTPEEWRRQIGEEEWKKSFYTGNRDENYPKDSTMVFEGKEYHVYAQLNKRIVKYDANQKITAHGVITYDYLFYDIVSQQILYHKRSFVSKGAPAIANSLEGLKFWITYASTSCDFGDQKRLTGYDYSSKR